jgi:tetratricopeptide (TPR) repeat protein
MNPMFLQNLQNARQLIKTRNHAEGLALYAKLSAESPDCGAEYGRAAAHCGDFDLAVRIWEKIRSADPNNFAYIHWLAGEYAKLGLNSKSRALLSTAAIMEPRNLDVQIKLAWLLSRTGGVEEGRDALNRCLALDARNQMALYLSAHLDRRENKFDAAEQQLRKLLSAGVTKPNVRYACRSELALILDRTERFDEAIAELKNAKKDAQKSNSLAKTKISFVRRDKEVRETRALPKNILETWTKTFPNNVRATSPPLVFMTGSSRSGTTLLERILDAHPSLAACDEPFAFQKIQPYISVTAPQIPANELNVWRQRYVKNLAVHLGTTVENRTLLDKNPSHTFWLPAFLRTFPELRVLIGLRDPRDVLVSLYFQDQPQTNCLGFEQLAQHYSDVMELWLAVRDWKGLTWMETRYEDIVSDLEKEGKRVTQFIGLEWNESQARFHEKNREKPILSTNYSDVTKPVYSRAVGRWRAYEKHLKPFLPLFEPYCKKFGYA